MFNCFGHSNYGHSGSLNHQDRIVLKIEGMTGGHSQSSLAKRLSRVPGVAQVKVDLVQKQAVIFGTANRSVLVTVVNDAGYKVLDN